MLILGKLKQYVFCRLQVTGEHETERPPRPRGQAVKAGCPLPPAPCLPPRSQPASRPLPSSPGPAAPPRPRLGAHARGPSVPVGGSWSPPLRTRRAPTLQRQLGYWVLPARAERKEVQQSPERAGGAGGTRGVAVGCHPSGRGPDVVAPRWLLPSAPSRRTRGAGEPAPPFGRKLSLRRRPH